MKRRIEQEIDQTLNCLGQSGGIEVSDLFVDTVSSKISHLRSRRGIGYGSRAFYPVAIALMVAFNFAILAAAMAPQQSVEGQTVDQVSVIASEYGIGQSAYVTFRTAMMDYFTKNKMLFWCVVILVLVNIVTLTSFWLRKPPFGPQGGPGRTPGPGGQRIMEEQLQLSAEQARKFESLRDEHFMQTRSLQEGMHKIRLDLLDEIFAAEANDTTIQKLTAEIGSLQSQFEKNSFRHFLELKEACNKQQVENLKTMLRDLIESTRPHDPQHHPPGPEGGMQPGHRPPPPPNR